MGMEQGNAVFLGLLLCATSVSISVQTLRDLGKMKTRESTTMLGAAVFDDILVVILLAFAMSFLGTDDVNLTMVILKKVVFFASIILIGWKGVPAIMRWLSPLRVSEPIVSATYHLFLIRIFRRIIRNCWYYRCFRCWYCNFSNKLQT